MQKDSADKIDEATRKYQNSEKGKIVAIRYSKSEKGKKAQRRYAGSEKGQMAQLRYRMSEKGKKKVEEALAMSKLVTQYNKFQQDNPEASYEDFLASLGDTNAQ